MKATNYIYASAKIRVLEPQILDNTDIERMLDAPDLKSAFKVLNDTDYGDNLLEVEPENYRQALAADFQQLHDFLQKISPSKRLFELMMLPRDFINLKLFFKAKQFGINVDDHIKANVLYSPQHLQDFVFENHIHAPETMKAYIDDQKGQILDQDIKDVIYKTSKVLTEKTRPDEIDAILTQHFHDLSLTLSKGIGSKFIYDYFKMRIDTANLLIWSRGRRLKLTKEQLKAKLIKRGHADISRMISLYPDDPSGLKAFVNAHFDLSVVKAFNEFCEDDKLFKLERVIENYKNSYIKQAKRFSYGPEVIFAYYQAKLTAVANVRIILTGKLNNIPVDAIRKTLRDVY